MDGDIAWWKEHVYVRERNTDRDGEKITRTVQWEQADCLASPSLVRGRVRERSQIPFENYRIKQFSAGEPGFN